MENVVSRRCEHPDGCSKHAYFRLRGSKKPTRCAAHKEDGMEDVKRTCEHPDGYYKGARFGYPGSKPVLCSTHKEVGMADVKTR